MRWIQGRKTIHASEESRNRRKEIESFSVGVNLIPLLIPLRHLGIDWLICHSRIVSEWSGPFIKPTWLYNINVSELLCQTDTLEYNGNKCIRRKKRIQHLFSYECNQDTHSTWKAIKLNADKPTFNISVAQCATYDLGEKQLKCVFIRTVHASKFKDTWK